MIRNRLPSAVLIALVIMIVAIVPAVFSYALNPPPLPESAPLDPHAVTADAFSNSSQPTLWIDARSQEAFDRDHIPDALLLNEERWDDLLPAVLETWQPGTRIVVYCNGTECQKSRKVAARLRTEVGLDNVYYLYGGWKEWKKRNR